MKSCQATGRYSKRSLDVTHIESRARARLFRVRRVGVLARSGTLLNIQRLAAFVAVDLIVERVLLFVSRRTLFQGLSIARIGILIVYRRLPQGLHPLRRLLRSHVVDDPLGYHTLHIRAAHEEYLQHGRVALVHLLQDIARNVGLGPDDTLHFGHVRVLCLSQHNHDAAILQETHTAILKKVSGRHARDPHQRVEDVRTLHILSH
mmetsp:Transcript_40882/g.89478  ORF Transcript_40882/g.89478 Transcript_40882/m.89478 type:complete len:205 (-) Transcript_40882:1753-2367(-)